MANWRAIRSEIESNDYVYVLAVSGGVDSMVLLDFFRRCNCDFVVAHFDHNLQPANMQMKLIVRDVCQRAGLNFTEGQGYNIASTAQFSGTGVENEARRQRYIFLRDVCDHCSKLLNKPAKIVTGHHKDDQVETVLLNLFRGVELTNVFMKKMNNDVYRPFLSVRSY